MSMVWVKRLDSLSFFDVWFKYHLIAVGIIPVL